MSYYERLDIGHPDRSYKLLFSIVRKRLEQARRDRTKDALQNSLLRRGKAMVSAGGDVGVRGRSPSCPKGVCRTWFSKGSCSKGNSCSYSHDKESRGKGRGRTASPKGGVKGNGKGGRERSPSRTPKVCSYFLKGKCQKGENATTSTLVCASSGGKADRASLETSASTFIVSSLPEGRQR